VNGGSATILKTDSVDTVLRLGAFFGTDAQSWINLQTHYDAESACELTDEMHMLVQAGAETVAEGDSALNAPRWSTERPPCLTLCARA
jgi:hypothetical protein